MYVGTFQARTSFKLLKFYNVSLNSQLSICILLFSGPPSLFGVIWSCLVVFDKIGRPPDIRSDNLKHFVCPRVRWAIFRSFGQLYQTCLARACVPRLPSGLHPWFDLCLIKHVWTVWPLTSTSLCLVTKQCSMMFGRQTFTFWTAL